MPTSAICSKSINISFFYFEKNYGAREILTCTPALVSIVGAEDETYGFTRRWSKYSFTLMRLLM